MFCVVVYDFDARLCCRQRRRYSVGRQQEGGLVLHTPDIVRQVTTLVSIVVGANGDVLEHSDCIV